VFPAGNAESSEWIESPIKAEIAAWVVESSFGMRSRVFTQPGTHSGNTLSLFTAFGSHLTPIVFWRLVFVFPALFIGRFTGVD
jgi:hypothetical protein